MIKFCHESVRKVQNEVKNFLPKMTRFYVTNQKSANKKKSKQKQPFLGSLAHCDYRFEIGTVKFD